MELTVKSLNGSFVVSDISSSSTVGDLKQLLHQQHSAAPEPEEQRLVFRHEVLASPDVALQQLGITHGDQLVMLAARPSVKRPRPQTTPAADTAAIRAAITDEARARGIEHTLREDRPAPLRRPAGAPPLMPNLSPEELMQFLQRALDGQLPPGLRLSSSGGGGGEGAGPHVGEEEEEEEEEEAELQVPEPSTERIEQLVEMGFVPHLARKALLLARGRVEGALEWLLQHGEDADAGEPPTQEQLRQIYGARRRGGRGGSSGGGGGRLPGSIAGVSTEQLVAELTDMGFDAAAAQAVLARVGPQLELAVQLLLGGAGTAAGQQAPSDGGAAAGGPAAAAAASGGEGEAAAGGVAGGVVEGGGEGGGEADAAAGRRSSDAADLTDGTDEDDQFEEEDDDDEYEDEEEEEFYDGDEEALYDLPLGAMQLANLGSADMEQLLQGANLQELTLGNQLLMEGMEGAGVMAGGGPQASLLRLLDSPAFLQQLAAGADAGAQQPQPQQQPAQQQQHPDAGRQHSPAGAAQQQQPSAAAPPPPQQQPQPQHEGQEGSSNTGASGGG